MISDKWKIVYTTPREIVTPILRTEYVFQTKPIIVLYLGLQNSIPGHNGKPVPMNHDFGSFRNEDKRLDGFNLPRAKAVANEHKMFVHPFILNNFATNTPQVQYLDVFWREAKNKLDLDIKDFKDQDLVSKVLKSKFIDKDLLCTWACWAYEERGMFCYGPSGLKLTIT